MRRAACLSLFFTLTVAIPFASASPLPVGPQPTSRVEMHGDVSWSSPLLALEVFEANEGQMGLSIQGAIHAEYDYAKTWAVGPVRVTDDVPETDEGTQGIASDAHAFVATSFAASDVAETNSYHYIIVPLQDSAAPRIAGSTPFLSVVPSRDDVVEYGSSVRPPEIIDVQDAAEVAPSSGPEAAAPVIGSPTKAVANGLAELVVSGCFRVVLWDIAGTLQAPDGPVEVYSGARTTGYTPAGAAKAVVSHEQAQYLYFDVCDGIAKILVPHGNYHLFSVETEASVQGSVLFEEDGQARQADGSFDALVRSDGDLLSLRLARPEGEGPSSPLAQVRAVSTGAFASSSLWAVLAVAGLGASALAGRRAWLSARFRALEAHFDGQRYADVVGLAGRFEHSGRYRWQAGTMGVVALLKLGRSDQAVEALGRLEGLPEARPQALDYLAACIAAARGDQAAAARLLGDLDRPSLEGLAAAPAQPSIDLAGPRRRAEAWEGYA